MIPIIECVPNFSEGKDLQVIGSILAEIEKINGVQLLNVDPGKAANRTVVTFVGDPDAVCEAAFNAVKKAAEVIDMRKHKGIHPRFGATDVCPLIPISGITIDEVVVYARNLAKRIGEELGIPVYCYESAAFEAKRRDLAYCRQGEYEGLANKICSEGGLPDFGPKEWNGNVARSGAVAVGARNFLIAYNINLDTKSVHLANVIASEIREKGKIKRKSGNEKDGIITDEYSKSLNEPGLLKAVKAIGWYVEEYGIAQVSMNLTDISVTPLHKAFDVVSERASFYDVGITGSELVGLIPLSSVLDAGRYFLTKKNLSTDIPKNEIVKAAVQSLGLNDLAPFDPQKKIIEYLMNDKL